MINAKAKHAGEQIRIPVYRPDLSGNERDYVLDCIDSSWISSLGSYIERFENALAEITKVENAVSLCNGTVALHLAIHCLDIGPGDEVIIPSFTYIASVNTIAQTGARPVFVDCLESDWLIDPEKIEAAISPRTRAIMAVHLYGAVCDMTAIMDLARSHGLRVIEDCAECLGSSSNGRHPGSFGDIGTFSFFGNKTITTGEGGAVVARDPQLAARLRKVKGQGQSLTRRYWHEELGFNYRMTNVAAAIGVAQAERLPEILARKKRVASDYRSLTENLPVTFQRLAPGVESSEWLVSVLLPGSADRDKVMEEMSKQGVETRPVFHCAHQMPMYDEGDRPDLFVSEDISRRGISLPSFPSLTKSEIERVVDSLGNALKAQGLNSA